MTSEVERLARQSLWKRVDLKHAIDTDLDDHKELVITILHALPDAQPEIIAAVAQAIDDEFGKYHDTPLCIPSDETLARAAIEALSRACLGEEG